MIVRRVSSIVADPRFFELAATVPYVKRAVNRQPGSRSGDS